MQRLCRSAAEEAGSTQHDTNDHENKKHDIGVNVLLFHEPPSEDGDTERHDTHHDGIERSLNVEASLTKQVYRIARVKMFLLVRLQRESARPHRTGVRPQDSAA